MDEAEEIRKKFESFSYRDLQKEAKKLNIKANGKTEVLLERIVEKVLEDLASTQTTTASKKELSDMSSVDPAKAVPFQEYQEDTSVGAEESTPENEKLLGDYIDSTQASTADKEEDANMPLVDPAKEMSSEEKAEEIRKKYEVFSYNELQKEAKKLKVKATGKKQLLFKRIVEKVLEDLASTQTTTADKEEPADMSSVNSAKAVPFQEYQGDTDVGGEQSTPENEKLEYMDSTHATTADKEEDANMPLVDPTKEMSFEEKAEEIRKKYEVFSYNELQKEAKKLKVKANGKTKVLFKRIVEKVLEDLASTQTTTADKEEPADMSSVNSAKAVPFQEYQGDTDVGGEQSTPENEKLEYMDSTHATTADKEEDANMQLVDRAKEMSSEEKEEDARTMAEESAHENEKLEYMDSTHATTADKEEDDNMQLVDRVKEVSSEEKEEDARTMAEESAPENEKLEYMDSTQATTADKEEDANMQHVNFAKKVSFQEYKEDTSDNAEHSAHESEKLFDEDLNSTKVHHNAKRVIDASTPKKRKDKSATPGTFRRHINTVHQHASENMIDIETDQKQKEERHKQLTRNWTPTINRLAQPKLRNTPSPKQVFASPSRAVSPSPFFRGNMSTSRAISPSRCIHPSPFKTVFSPSHLKRNY